MGVSLDIRIQVVSSQQKLAERVGFEPTVRLLGVQTISSRPRYGHFGTSPLAMTSMGIPIKDFRNFQQQSCDWLPFRQMDDCPVFP